MISGYLTVWMIAEKPSFALAVAEYYSIIEGNQNQNPAAFGEIAYWQASEEILARNPDELSGSDQAFYQRTLARIENQLHRVRQAVRH